MRVTLRSSEANASGRQPCQPGIPTRQSSPQAGCCRMDIFVRSPLSVVIAGVEPVDERGPRWSRADRPVDGGCRAVDGVGTGF